MVLRRLKLFVIIWIGVMLPLSADDTDLSAEANKTDTSKLNTNNDHGFWNEQKVKVALGHQWFARLRTEQRWGNDYRQFWWHEYEIVFAYDPKELISACPESIFKDFSFGAGINETTQIQANTENVRKWVWITRPILEAFLDLAWHDWRLEQRMRGEYYDYNASHYKNYGLYRHRVNIYSPWKFTRFNINPFFSNEFFFRKNTAALAGGLYENRLKVGVANDLYKTLTSELFWQWRYLKQKTGPGINTYQIGLTLYLSLDACIE